MRPGVCEVTRDRIRIALWAYAYDCKSYSFVSDAEYDALAKKVANELDKPTSRPDLDDWFKKNFSSHTGYWVRQHPELNKLDRIYNILKK